MVSKQLRLFPKTATCILRCVWCAIHTVHFIASTNPFIIKCDECGNSFDDRLK